MDSNASWPRPSIHLKRYMEYYQFESDKFLPDKAKAGSAREWHFFRIVHKVRVQWENELRARKERESKEESGQDKPRRHAISKSRATETGSRMAQAKREESPGVRRAREERQRIQEAQKRLGVPEYNKYDNKTPQGATRPKGFKGTRLKRRGKQ